MIDLNEEYEQDWLEFCLNQPEKITALPVELYHKFFDFLTQEGRWNDVFKITQVKDKIVYQTVDEIISGAEVIYSSTWSPQQAKQQYDRLLAHESDLTDDEFAYRVELLYECTPVHYMISSQELEELIRRRVIDYCRRMGTCVQDYDGPFLNNFKYLFT